MKYCERIAEGIDVAHGLAQLAAHPELWNVDNERTTLPNSPHAQASDLWLRSRPRREIDSLKRFGEPHFPEWYPAWDTLTALHPIVFDLARDRQATSLGFCMLSRIPAGGTVLPHSDKGWHADHFACKTYIILKANEGCVNKFPGEEVRMRAGEIWLFENRVLHAVENNGDDDRIAAVVTMRTA